MGGEVKRNATVRGLQNLFVFGVDFPNCCLDQALDHSVQTNTALGAFGNAHLAGTGGANFHLKFFVALGHLRGGEGVHNLLAHADDPDAG